MPAVVTISIALLGYGVEQIHEVVRVHLLDLDWSDVKIRGIVSLLVIYVLLYQLTFAVLLWSNYAIANRFPRPLAHNSVLRAALTGLPVMLGVLIWVGAFFAVQRAAAGLSGNPLLLSYGLQGLALLAGAATVGSFYVPSLEWTIELLRRSERQHAPVPKRSKQPYRPAFVFFPTSHHNEFLAAALFFGVILFIVATLNPWWLGTWFGTIGTMLAAAVAVLPFLTWLTASPRVPRWHGLSILVSIAVFGAPLTLMTTIRSVRLVKARSS